MAFSGGQNSYGWPMNGEFRLLWKHFDQEKDKEPFHPRRIAHIVEACPGNVLGNLIDRKRRATSWRKQDLNFPSVFAHFSVPCSSILLIILSWSRCNCTTFDFVMFYTGSFSFPYLVCLLYLAPFTFSAMWPCQYTF